VVNNENFSNPEAYDQYKPAESSSSTDFSKPVAYDNEGRPLYAHPPTAAEQAKTGAVQMVASQPSQQYVHFSRAIDPEAPDIPPEILRRYEESKRTYPHLNLSKGEFVISDVSRHPIGIVKIWAIALLLIVSLMGVVLPLVVGDGSDQQMLLLTTIGFAFLTFFIFGGALIATYVYRNNRFYLTNESVIQEIQISLFNKHEQTVSLSNIEDASYYQNGIIPHFFNYGMIRLSTEGDETTYRFSYVADPKRHIAVLNNAVEAFKNGRPVEVDGHPDQPS
jgi:uncharacterized membrane protein YdbT with pleckstrin-like domain